MQLRVGAILLISAFFLDNVRPAISTRAVLEANNTTVATFSERRHGLVGTIGRSDLKDVLKIQYVVHGRAGKGSGKDLASSSDALSTWLDSGSNKSRWLSDDALHSRKGTFSSSSNPPIGAEESDDFFKLGYLSDEQLSDSDELLFSGDVAESRKSDQATPNGKSQHSYQDCGLWNLDCGHQQLDTGTPSRNAEGWFFGLFSYVEVFGMAVVGMLVLAVIPYCLRLLTSEADQPVPVRNQISESSVESDADDSS